MGFAGTVMGYIKAPFETSDARPISLAGKFGYASTAVVGAYATYELGKAALSSAASVGTSCAILPKNSFLIPLTQVSSILLKTLGQTATDCSANMKTFVVVAVAAAATGAVVCKAVKTWPNPQLSFGHTPRPPVPPRSHS